MRHSLIILVGLAFLWGGCASEVDPSSRSASLERRLAGAGEYFAFGPGDGDVSFAARIQNVDGSDPRVVPIQVTLLDGQINARHDAAGNLTIEQFDVRIDDIRISVEALPPHGLDLTDVRVTLANPVVGGAEWTSDGRAVTTVVGGDLLVDWAFSNDAYDHLPLAQQTIRDIALSVTVVEAGDGDLLVTLEGAAAGEFLAWSEFVELNDLNLAMTGVGTLR